MSCCGPKTVSNKNKFNTDLKEKLITDKFWCVINSKDKILDNSKISYYEKEIDKIHKYDARCHSKVPRYTNQTYGWLPGYKIRFLQSCDLNLYQKSAFQKVAKNLVQQYFKGQKTLIDHCACKNLLKVRDHWKIV